MRVAEPHTFPRLLAAGVAAPLLFGLFAVAVVLRKIWKWA
jgi:hypothetical protein